MLKTDVKSGKHAIPQPYLTEGPFSDFTCYFQCFIGYMVLRLLNISSMC